MRDPTWIDLAIAFIAGLPGLIAALSSFHNGRRLENLKRVGAEDRAKLARFAMRSTRGHGGE